MKKPNRAWHLARPLLVAAFLGSVIVTLVRVSISYRATEISLPPSQILLLSSAFSLLPALFAVGMGRYNDLHGNGRSVVAGGALTLFACVLLAIPAGGLIWLFAVSTLLGFAHTLQLGALQGEVGVFRLPRLRDRMIGSMMLWQAIGQVVAPMVLSAVALFSDKFAMQLAIVATVFAALSLLISILIFRHSPAPMKRLAAPIGTRQILAVPGIWWVIVSSGLCVAVYDLIVVYMPVIGAERGIHPSEVGILLAIFACGQMVSRALYGTARRKVPARWLILYSVIGTASCTIALGAPFGTVILGVLLGAVGLFLGFAITSSVSLTMSMSPPGSRATSLGLRLATNRASQFFMPIVGGGAAAFAGPGSVFFLLGGTLLLLGLTGGRTLRVGRSR